MTDPMELVARLEVYRPTNEWGDPVHHVIIDEAAACIREMVEWRPIETAPGPDHAMFVVRAFDVETFSGVIYTSDPVCVWRNIDGSFARWKQEFQPTHWLPLPPAPGAEA